MNRNCYEHGELMPAAVRRVGSLKTVRAVTVSSFGCDNKGGRSGKLLLCLPAGEMPESSFSR